MTQAITCTAFTPPTEPPQLTQLIATLIVISLTDLPNSTAAIAISAGSSFWDADDGRTHYLLQPRFE